MQEKIIALIEGYKVSDGLSFDGSLPPPDILMKMYEETEMLRGAVNTILDMIINDIKKL